MVDNTPMRSWLLELRMADGTRNTISQTSAESIHGAFLANLRQADPHLASEFHGGSKAGPQRDFTISPLHGPSKITRKRRHLDPEGRFAIRFTALGPLGYAGIEAVVDA